MTTTENSNVQHPLETKLEVGTADPQLPDASAAGAAAAVAPQTAAGASANPSPPGSPDVRAQTPDSAPRSPPRRRVSSKKRRSRKSDGSGRLQHGSSTIPELEEAAATDATSAALHGFPQYPVTPNIDDMTELHGLSKAKAGRHEGPEGSRVPALPTLLPEFRTTLTLVQVLGGGGGLAIAGDDRPGCTVLSCRAFVTRSWLLIVRLLYVAHAVMLAASVYYLSVSSLPNVTIFWPSTTLNLIAALSNHVALNRHTDKLYVLLGTLSARQPKNIKTCIVVVLASITALAAMLTLRFYELSSSQRNRPLTGSRAWTVYTFAVLYFCRNFESLIVVGSTVFVMVLYALIAAAIKFELRAIVDEPVPQVPALVRHSTVAKLVAYSDALFSPLCCFWVAAVIGNLSEGLAMARYHQTEYALPHITTWAHAVMLAAGYFAICECSYGLAAESERVRLWVHRRNQSAAAAATVDGTGVLRYLNQQRNFRKTLKLWESIDLSRQAVVISLALPVTLYVIILLVLDPITHGS